MILFDGHYREKEIDVFFGVNPRNTMGQRLIYQQLLPSGEVYTPKDNENGTQSAPQGLLESIKLENAMIGFQLKHNFYIVDEKNARVDLTIQDCANNIELEGKCIDITIEARSETVTVIETGEKIEMKNVLFPSKMRIRLKLGNL